MNGEIADLCRVVLSVRKALITHAEPENTDSEYVSDTSFISFNSSGRKDLRTWYKDAVAASLCDVKLLLPTRVKNRSILGFTNTHDGWMTCYYADGTKTRMIPVWRYSREQNCWKVEYSEMPWEDAPAKIPVYHDHTEQFKRALDAIRKFADKICEPIFSARFAEALSVLSDTEGTSHKNTSRIQWPHAGNYLAADIADVFGAMGSWNDTPEGKANAIYLGNEYNRLSADLLEQVRLNLMYAVNEGIPV